MFIFATAILFLQCARY